MYHEVHRDWRQCYDLDQGLDDVYEFTNSERPASLTSAIIENLRTVLRGGIAVYRGC